MYIFYKKTIKLIYSAGLETWKVKVIFFNCMDLISVWIFGMKNYHYGMDVLGSGYQLL